MAASSRADAGQLPARPREGPPDTAGGPALKPPARPRVPFTTPRHRHPDGGKVVSTW